MALFRFRPYIPVDNEINVNDRLWLVTRLFYRWPRGVNRALYTSVDAMARVLIGSISNYSRNMITSIVGLPRVKVATMEASSRLLTTTESSARITIDEIEGN